MGNLKRMKVTMQLVRITIPTGEMWVVWIEPAWLPALKEWCEGGAVMTDPTFIS